MKKIHDSVDEDFPPNSSSLYNSENSKLNQKELEIWKSFEWRKPHEIFQGEFSLFSDGIDPGDIKQGCLGNWYFLSAISAMAEFPNQVKKIFLHKEINEDGIYAVNFTLGGENYTVLVDDYIPYYVKKNKPAFSQSKGKELWVMLLEKAWAKVNGNYENSIKGFVSEAFRALTGAPVVFFKHMYIQDIWEEISEADKNKYIICASSGEGQLNKARYDEMGLISEHAYSVISAILVDTQSGEERLLKLRNPWGHKEWLGKWSDNDESWTDELRQRLGWEEKNDGVFFMCVEDYLSYFRTTVICKLHEDFISNSIRCKHNTGEYNLIKITIEDEGKIFFTVSQLNQRWARRQQEYEPSFVRMLLSRILAEDEDDCEDFPLQYIEGKCWKDEDTTIEWDWVPGKYLAFIEIHWFDDKQFNDLVFRTYSKISPKIEEINKDEYPNFLKDTMKSWARSSSVVKTYEEKGEPDIFRCFSITESKAEYGFLYYENNSAGTVLREIVKFGELEHLKIMPPYGGDSVEVKVNPGENEIVLLNRDDRGWSFNSTYYTTLIKPVSETLKIIKEKGKRHQIEYKEDKYDVNYYVYKDGSGYLWYFENNSNENEDKQPFVFDGTFYLKLENLEIDDENARESNEWKVKLKPGESSHMKLIMKDVTKSWGYKYSYSFKIKEEILNNEKLIEKVKKSGKKKQISFKDQKVEVFYYIYFINERYIWFYENLTDKKFKATFVFELTNLKIDREESEADSKNENEWDLLLLPGESCTKTISRIDPKAESKYRSSYSYRLSSEDE